ncbi:MAG: hypothetical protein ACLPY5_03320 [Candidatus Bathyarchaeia archaeon]
MRFALIKSRRRPVTSAFPETRSAFQTPKNTLPIPYFGMILTQSGLESKQTEQKGLDPRRLLLKDRYWKGIPIALKDSMSDRNLVHQRDP